MTASFPWSTEKPLIGMIHLGLLPGQQSCEGIDPLVERALADLRALEVGGIDAVLLENWKDDSPTPFVEAGSLAALSVVTRAVVEATSLPVGVNVLPNDYRAAFALVAACGARFVQLDVFTDPVRTDYSYSHAPPFEVRVDLDDVAAWRSRLDAGGAPLLASVHPKHYTLLEGHLPIEESAREAFRRGADAVVVTGTATGFAPTPERVRRVKEAVGERCVLVGSGLTAANAPDLLGVADGAIVGTSLKTPDFARVEVEKVRALVGAVSRDSAGAP